MKTILYYSLTLILFMSFTINGQSKDKNKKIEKKDSIKSIKEVTKNAKLIPGLFDVFQDTINGKVFIQINKDQLNKEYIHFAQIMDAPTDFYERGSYSYEKVFKFQRSFEKVEIVLQNITTYFDPESPLSRAAGANINQPIIYSEKIVAISEDKSKLLIAAEPLFLKEAFSQIKPKPNPKDKDKNRLKLGELSKGKTKFLKIKSFSKNTDFRVEMVYDNSSEAGFYNGWEGDLTDPRFLSIKVYNSIIEMPDNDYRPRYDDPRVGYFGQRINDLTDRSSTPYKDVISRWHLKKKNRGALLSEPVEPINWWIENTTPLDFREHIKNGILKWNVAFEQAGFKNAMVVKIQPDDADWDADDIRYNVIRWVSQYRSLYGGAYGPSFFNPRTGQILGADVIMYYGFIRLIMVEDELYGNSESFENKGFNPKSCSYANELKYNFLAGRTLINVLNRNEREDRELIKQALNMLALHEVGHTLGLNHNFMGSHFLDGDKIHDKDFTQENGMTGSVMDYSGINISPDPAKQGLYYEVTPGPYDRWAIEYGYSEFSEEQEKQKLDEILSRSTQPELIFGNDADDMRRPGIGIDPRAMTWDQSSDPIQYAINRFELIDEALKELKTEKVGKNTSYQSFKNNYYLLIRGRSPGLRMISRHIGGIYVDRSFTGQESSLKPYTPVPYDKQKYAMEVLDKYAFSPTALKTPSEIYNYLQNQRRGFDHYGKNEDPKIHDQILSIHKDLLNHLLHVNTWKRVLDSELYGNKYHLNEFATDLTNSIFFEDLSSAVNYKRQNLQSEYVTRLAGILNGKNYSHVSKAVAFNQINSIKKMLKRASTKDQSTKSHRSYLNYMIDDILDID